MQLHILLTPEIKAAMPSNIKVLVNYGEIAVIFPAEKEGQVTHTMNGDNAVVEATQEEVIKWLLPFDGVPIGSGVPQAEAFTIMHIKKEL
jgi:hypothetical protein